MNWSQCLEAGLRRLSKLQKITILNSLEPQIPARMALLSYIPGHRYSTCNEPEYAVVSNCRTIHPGI